MERTAPPAVLIDAQQGSAIVLHLNESHVVLPSQADVSPFDNHQATVYDVESPSFGSQCDECNVPHAYAALTEPLLQSPETQPLHNYTLHIATATAQPVGYSRPEFLFAKVIKPSKESSCGLFLKNRDGKVVVNRIAETGLFSKSSFRPGDRVISVNGFSCLTATAQKVAKLIHSAVVVSIGVHNKEGDPNLVSNSIPKPTPDAKVGVTLKSYQGAIHVGRVDTDGLFVGTLLTPGHRCISINDVHCSTLTAAEAVQVVANARDIVTIVSEPQQYWATVLSCDAANTSSRWNRMAVGSGVAAGALAVGALATMH
jgi:predicted metalloprotease with PDZ domain